MQVETKKKNTKAKELSALAVVSKRKWIKQLRGACIAADGKVSVAAKSLGISARHLWRWVRENPGILKGTGHKKNPALSKKSRRN